MGRIFETRKATMFARWDRMAKAFTRCGREIAVAVRQGGENPETNPALRRAIQNARAVNMPKDRIKNAIDKASGAGDAEAFEELTYEGYGPHGVAIIVESATDNPTRTVANVRAAFKKGNGTMGASGSVSFLFDRFGVFHLRPEGFDRDTLELELIDHGVEEILDGQDADGKPTIVLRCSRENFGNIQAALDAKKIEPVSSALEWIPKTETALTEEQAAEVLALIERLEQDDDVQKVFTNAE